MRIDWAGPSSGIDRCQTDEKIYLSITDSCHTIRTYALKPPVSSLSRFQHLIHCPKVVCFVVKDFYALEACELLKRRDQIALHEWVVWYGDRYAHIYQTDSDHLDGVTLLCR
jgi:hypothetical protein